MTVDFEALLEAARNVSRRAYCPYSKFAVGAAVVTASGDIFAACNVENVSSGLTVCAERNAVAAAVAAGHRQLTAAAVYTPTARPTAPCGACRQVLHEFGPQMVVQCSCDGPGKLVERLSRLLPEAFDESALRPLD